MSLWTMGLGFLVLLILGVLLAGLAALLPRILVRWEERPEAEKLSLQAIGLPSVLPVPEDQKPNLTRC